MAETTGRPAGMNWLIPYLTVADADAALAFYERAFGFERADILPGADGRTLHASMNYQGATLLMFSPEGEWAGQMRTPAHSGGDPAVNLYVYCPDVDALAARAGAAGAELLGGPEDMFWGDRIVRLRDPDGWLWTFATQVGEFDPSKMPKM